MVKLMSVSVRRCESPGQGWRWHAPHSCVSPGAIFTGSARLFRGGCFCLCSAGASEYHLPGGRNPGREVGPQDVWQEELGWSVLAPLVRGQMALGSCCGLFPHPPQTPSQTWNSGIFLQVRGPCRGRQTLMLPWGGIFSFGRASSRQIKTPDVSRFWCPLRLSPPPQSLGRETLCTHTFPWELSPPKSPSTFKVTCQSPSPGGFLAQGSPPGGLGWRKGPAPPSPTPTWDGTQGFWREE